MSFRAPWFRGTDGPAFAACSLAVSLLASCGPPPQPVPVVVVVPVAPPPSASVTPEEPTSLSCPPHTALIAGGNVKRGNKSRRVNDYCMDLTEVTSGAYGHCVEKGSCSGAELECDDAWTYGKPELADHPINCVSWPQADAFCRAAGKRLPTSDEWEWAAQARFQERRFSWGNSEPDDAQMCWSKGTSRSGTCSVGSFPVSQTPEGIHDLFGNVWEWLSPPLRNGVANVARGGSWQNDDLDVLEGENAGSFIAEFVRNDVVGFRCVYDGAQPRRPPAPEEAEPAEEP